MRLDPLTHSRPTVGFDGESGLNSLYTFTVKGLSFDVMFDPVVTNGLFRDTSLYRNCDFLKENALKCIIFSTHSSKDKPFRGSLTPFSSTHLSYSAWVGCGSDIGFTVDKTSTHVNNDAWVETWVYETTRPTQIGTLRVPLCGSWVVPNFRGELNG